MEEPTSLRPIAYSLQFRGSVRDLSERVFEVRASAPSQALVTIVNGRGMVSRLEPSSGAEAILLSRLALATDGSFDESGMISFAPSSNIRFRTMGAGRLCPSPNPHLRHGTAVWEVEDGDGQFERARGRITSNFLVSDTGEVTDNHLGLIFVPQMRVNADAPESRTWNRVLDSLGTRAKRNTTGKEIDDTIP